MVGDSDALLLKQIPKKQIGFVLVLNQNKPGLFFRFKTKTNQIDLVKNKQIKPHLVFDNEN
jgi:hypothetical protein